jgi:hypothetical protein
LFWTGSSPAAAEDIVSSHGRDFDVITAQRAWADLLAAKPNIYDLTTLQLQRNVASLALRRPVSQVLIKI